MIASRKQSYDKPRQYIEKQRHHFASKGPYSQDYGLSSSHVLMWELDHKEGWVLKNWFFQTVVLEKALESPLDSKEIKPVNPRGNQSWIFIGRTDAEAEALVLWLPDMKSQLIGKDPDDGKNWRQKVKGMTEDQMVGWLYQLNGQEFEQTPGDSEGQGVAVFGVVKSWTQWVTERQESPRQFTVNFRCLETHYVLDNWHKPWQRFL